MLPLWRAAALIAATVLALPAEARDPLPQDVGSVGLRQSLRGLAAPYRVLQIVAHPDDEDSAALTYLARGLGAQVTIATLTRGEAGANLVTGDFFDALGVLRTLEFRGAAQFYGARLRFATAADFGYSKTLSETLRNWNRERLVADLVRILREERPHVVLARFRGAPSDGHGHHQAAGLLTREAWEASGDRRRYRDAGPAWAPLKLYAASRRDGEPWTVEIDAGSYDPALGTTYAQIAQRGLRMHRSQGAGSTIAPAGSVHRRYQLLESRVGMAQREQSFFDRIELALPPGFAEAIADAGARFSIDAPENCLPPLLQALRLLREASGSAAAWPGLERRLEKAVEQSAGLQLEFLVLPEGDGGSFGSSFQPRETVSVAVPGSDLELGMRLLAHRSRPTGVAYRIEAPSGWTVDRLPQGTWRVTVPSEPSFSSVHWERDSPWEPHVRYTDSGRWGAALPAAPLTGVATYRISGVELRSTATAQASFIDGERVQRRRDLAVGPALSVGFRAGAGTLPAGSTEYPLSVDLESLATRPVAGHVRLQLPAGWSSDPAEMPVTLPGRGSRAMASFRLRPAEGTPPGTYGVRAEAVYGEASSTTGFRAVRYRGLETAYLASPARHEVRVVDVTLPPGLEVGYVMGTGDSVPAAIAQLGGEVTLLDEAFLAAGDLSGFHTILLGIRAYAVREDLKAFNSRLLDYVAGGGVLVVQYNTPEFDGNFGPYPYSMTRRPEEVSEEDAPVTVLEPDHPVFHWPNSISAADFEGWVEQRGSKFLVDWDPRYTALVESSDEGQQPQRGGWLVARHGQGLYVYSAYAWYRQLPYAVPGAVRLFANLVALGAPDAPWRRP